MKYFASFLNRLDTYNKNITTSVNKLKISWTALSITYQKINHNSLLRLPINQSIYWLLFFLFSLLSHCIFLCLYFYYLVQYFADFNKSSSPKKIKKMYVTYLKVRVCEEVPLRMRGFHDDVTHLWSRGSGWFGGCKNQNLYPNHRYLKMSLKK